MVKKRGLLVVFEGIDGAGTSTQVHKLAEYIEKLDKYQDVVRTHEPWDSAEIKRKLSADKDAYAGGREMAELFVDDRTAHTRNLIIPTLKAGAIVISDRYSMSTCAYQWAQGVPLEELIDLHKDRGILTPRVTYFVDVPLEVAESRLKKRGDAKEKFETDKNFVSKLIDTYKCLYHMAQIDQSFFGKVVLINGDQPIEKVTQDIGTDFSKVYSNWSESVVSTKLS